MAPPKDKVKMTKAARKKAADLLQAKATDAEKEKKRNKVFCIDKLINYSLMIGIV